MRLFIAFLALALASAAPANAQGGPLPSELASAGVTQAQWRTIQADVTRLSRSLNLSERSLSAVAERMGVSLIASGRGPDEVVGAITAQLDEQAQTLRSLRERLAALESAADPEIAAILASASASLESGDFSAADAALARAEASDTAAIRRAEGEIRSRQIRLATTISDRGGIAWLQADYLGAAAQYGRASDAAPGDAPERWRFRVLQAQMMRFHGSTFGSAASLAEAVRIMRSQVIPGISRAASPRDWASAQAELGLMLRMIGERGDEAAALDSARAYRAALEIYSRAETPTEWANAQRGLGTVLSVANVSGDAQLREAVTAFRTALQVFTREDNFSEWIITSNNLSIALTNLGGGGDSVALRDSVQILRVVLDAPSVDPNLRLTVQGNLASALLEMGEAGDAAALDESIALFRQVAAAHDPNSEPAAWAATQLNLSSALRVKGVAGNVAATREAITIARGVLAVRARENDALLWADAQSALGNAYLTLSEVEPAAVASSIAAHRAAAEVRQRSVTRLGWATTQFDLGVALRSQAHLGDVRAAREAVEIFRSLLEVRTRAANPRSWASTQYEYGRALLALNALGGGTADAAIAAHRAALEVRRRDQFPEAWAASQVAIAMALITRISDRTARDEVITSMRGVLSLRTERQDQVEAQTLLALALVAAFSSGDQAAIDEALLVAQAAVASADRSVSLDSWGGAHLVYSLAQIGAARGDRTRLAAVLPGLRETRAVAVEMQNTQIIAQMDALIAQVEAAMR